jgi:hypothetical protein
MDDEIKTDAQGRYAIVYSRAAERPVNTTAACGAKVTWQDFGTESRQILNIRWMSVRPEHYLPVFAPHSDTVAWWNGSWAEPLYDSRLVGENSAWVEGTATPVMGPYHPVVHRLSRQEFEALGCAVDADSAFPPW